MGRLLPPFSVHSPEWVTRSLAHRRRRRLPPMPSGERRNQSVLWGGERDWMLPRPTRREQTQQHSSTSTSTSTSTKRARWQGEDDEEDDQINGLPDRLELRRARVPSARLMPQLLYPFVVLLFLLLPHLFFFVCDYDTPIFFLDNKNDLHLRPLRISIWPISQEKINKNTRGYGTNPHLPTDDISSWNTERKHVESITNDAPICYACIHVSAGNFCLLNSIFVPEEIMCSELLIGCCCEGGAWSLIQHDTFYLIASHGLILTVLERRGFHFHYSVLFSLSLIYFAYLVVLFEKYKGCLDVYLSVGGYRIVYSVFESVSLIIVYLYR